jgi:hypothetical protein
MRGLALAALATMLIGCAAPTSPFAPVFEISASFDAAHARRLLQEGSNSVKGNAFMRQRGGGVVTCAGQAVRLVPATQYARQRFFALYGSNESGSQRGQRYRFNPDPPEYYANTREQKCDSQGNFLFERVADGEFFVATQITWQVGYSAEGGNLMQRVAVSGGKTVSIIMAP